MVDLFGGDDGLREQDSHRRDLGTETRPEGPPFCNRMLEIENLDKEAL